MSFSRDFHTVAENLHDTEPQNYLLVLHILLQSLLMIASSFHLPIFFKQYWPLGPFVGIEKLLPSPWHVETKKETKNGKTLGTTLSDGLESIFNAIKINIMAFSHLHFYDSIQKISCFRHSLKGEERSIIFNRLYVFC